MCRKPKFIKTMKNYYWYSFLVQKIKVKTYKRSETCHGQLFFVDTKTNVKRKLK